MIVAWSDSRSGDFDIYAQRVDASGNVLWADGGVPVCVAGGDQLFVQIAPDQSGGAFLAWNDQGRGSPDSRRIYAQHLDASGNATWTLDGIGVTSTVEMQYLACIAVDGQGGAIIGWYSSDPLPRRVLAQRLSPTGSLLWSGAGTELGSGGGQVLSTAIIPDGTRGAFVAWCDIDNGFYLSRVYSDGNPVWSGGPRHLSPSTPWNAEPVVLIGDRSGGTIVGWSSESVGSQLDVFAQRVADDGTARWQAGGVVVCSAPKDQHELSMVPDGSGGAVLAWRDERDASSQDISDVYAQRIDSAGVPQWATNGIVVCNAPFWQFNPATVADGAGGAIIAWGDSRGGFPLPGIVNLYAQRIGGDGSPQWTNNGVLLRENALDIGWQTGLGTGSGGAVFVWNDHRSRSNDDIFAQNVNGDGSLGGIAVAAKPSFVSAGTSAAGIHLSWYSATASSLTLDRKVGQAPWQFLASLEGDGRGVSTYDDVDVTAGVQYGYRICNGRIPPVECFDEISILVPVIGLSVSGTPNPTHGVMTIALSLSDAGPARLELSDVRGRSVLVRALTGLSPGPNQVRLEESARLRPGIYWLRLTQGLRTARGRVVVLGGRR